MSFVHHESILKAVRKFGIVSIFHSTNAECARLQLVLSEVMNGKTTKDQEFELIKVLARLEILLSQIVFHGNFKSDVDKQILVELEGLTDRVLSKDSIKERRA